MKPLKDIDLISEGIESVTYNFTEIIKMNTFVESLRWLKLKICIMNTQNYDNKRFQYSITLALYHQKIKIISFEYQNLSLLLTILTGIILVFHHNNKIIKHLK